MTDRRRLDDLLDRALDLPAEERSAFLDRSCHDTAERDAVARLLAASGPSDASLASGTVEPLAPRLWEELAEPGGGALPAGTRLGAYRVLGEIGRGGMAVVHLAERADGQYEQRVALKILQRPASDANAVARFERERRILASLEHPGIARILDGGIAPDGRPWFAMEHVDGARIDAWCDERRLDLAGRLRLFADVARAVAAAHRQLVVHRDIKPSNILVSPEGRPKLLDFGIAKLLESDPTDAAAASDELTHAAIPLALTAPMTPSYASPEQVAGAPVTTASDVYQLGLLLYELLTGERAFPGERSTPESLRRRAEGPEPTRPSAAVSSNPDGEQARRRGCTSPRELRRRLAGDLDTIVTTALRPLAERRYESAATMAADVERFLAGRPILARPDTLTYRTRKFVGRHRWAVGVATVAAVALVALATVDAARLRSERDAAEREAQKARQVSRFLADLFEASDPFTAKRVAGRTALELLDDGARRVEEGGALAGEPEVRAALLDTLGEVYGGLGLSDQALRANAQALALRRERLGAAHPETLESRLAEVSLTRGAGKLDEARDLARALLPELESALGPHDWRVAELKMQLTLAILEKGSLDEAKDLIASAVSIEESQRPPDPARLSRLLGVQSSVSSRKGDAELAVAEGRRAIELQRRLDPENPRIASILGGLAGDLQNLGRATEARDALLEAERILLARTGIEHPLALRLSIRIANLAILLGDPAAGLARLDAHLPIAERVLGAKSHWIGYGRMRRAMALVDLGRPDEALAEAARGRDATVAALGEAAPLAIDANRRLAGIQKDTGHFAEARVTLLHTLELAEQKLPAGNTVTPTTLHELADVELALGDAAAAEQAITRALARQSALWPDGHVDLARAYASQAEILARRGDAAGARAALRRALEMAGRVEGVTPALRERLAEIERRLPR
ncbi:MAG: protein kinase [Holophagales bacterium]|nr:MAG: protein kinase [Holophagales bacterium]